MKNEEIKKMIDQNGYAVVNVQDVYFYTVGMGSKGKKDLIGVKYFPKGLFDLVANRWYHDEIKPNVGFFVEEFNLPSSGNEPSRCKLLSLTLATCATIQEALAAPSRDFDSEGFLYVAGPDANNYLVGEENCSFKFTAEEHINKLVEAVKTDLDKALNEAQKVLRDLGIKK